MTQHAKNVMLQKVYRSSRNVDSLLLLFLKGFLMLSYLSICRSSLPSNKPFHPRQIQRLICTKCNGLRSSSSLNNNGSIWVYEGQLVNPITGLKICDVEGIELTRHLTHFPKNGHSNSSSNVRLLKDLKARIALFPKNSTADWDYANTIVSRKLFCYRDPQKKLLSTFKFRPGGKARKVSPQEAVALYDAATTYISCADGEKLVIQTEFPNGKCVTAKAADAKETTDNILEFTTFAKFSSSPNSPSLLAQAKSATDNNSRPPRRRWIQFGPDSSKSLNERFGARETYTYSNLDELPEFTKTKRRPFEKLATNIQNAIRMKNNTEMPVTMRYTRYGECPPWYGPHQYCSLELVGRRVPTLQDAPPLASSLARQTIPEFSSILRTHEGSTKIIDNGAAIIEAFRMSNLHFPSEDDAESISIRSNREKIQGKLKQTISRIFKSRETKASAK